MLIYNHQKDFLGIDGADLTKLGLSSLAQLRAEAADFADLFVKTPGYIHNFKHVHWIDFIECAESNDTANVIIHVNKQNFKCSIDIKTIFLVEAPTKKAYLIYLNNLRALTREETAEIANDIEERAIPEPASQVPTPTQHFETEAHEPLVMETQEPLEETPTAKIEHDLYEDNDFGSIDVFDTPSHDDAPLELDFSDDEAEVKPEPQKHVQEEPAVEENDFKLDLDIDAVEDVAEDIPYESDYVYDPTIASQELGLPLDLIEEFMGDFITQALDFKDQLYAAHDEGDRDKVKSLSHKLKGVAANLRIEDAFEVLSVINTSDDDNEIKNNLNIFYKIVAKLSSNEDVGVPPTAETPKVTTAEKTVESPQPQTPKKTEEIELPDLEELEPDVPQETEEIKTEPSPKPADDDVISIDLDDEILLDEPTGESTDQTTEEEQPIVGDIADEPKIVLDFDEEDLKIEDVEPEIPGIDEPKTQSTATKESDISYNKDSVAKKLGLDIESFNELFDDYTDESKATAGRIADAIKQNDSTLWKRHALKLKGMSNNMRVDELLPELDLLTATDDVNTARETLDKVQVFLEKISSL